MEGETVPLASEEPLKMECLHFLECIEQRTTPNTDGENGLRVLKILHMASESIHRHGEPVFAKREPRAHYFVHPTAVVDQPTEIGEGSKIWHFSHVMPKCKLGQNCNLGQNVHIAEGVRIGDNVKIQNNVSVYHGVELEDDVFCGPSMVFTNVINPRSHVNRKSEYQKTLVRRGATLGANSTIVCGVTVGRYAFVGAGAVVTKDVLDHAMVVGVPARQIGWACYCGTSLRETADLWSCAECGNNYYLNDGALTPVNGAYPERRAGTGKTMTASAGG
jgi:UDP-2-acetamido-3-amino-2,3-dideoxy-glucuronate N-acetyltransferase